MSGHWKTCLAPVCAGDPNPDYKQNVLWYPGESVCQKRPYQKFQKKQSLMNRYLKKGLLKYPNRCWTATMLEKRIKVKKAKGMNPDL